ncbi:insecticidal toxin [Bacillus sp. BB51/4]|uniref:RICIN domain-containing protein n=1 Tax=Bacillus sp. BB51/4 TaxID=2217819 RepID=UPI0011EC59EB|nr:RICIN domain-containing protein [Bacillus sp. BB51/4]KAA0768462.1 insecticidal toxin [Bacillus sp. BB51/4]
MTNGNKNNEDSVQNEIKSIVDFPDFNIYKIRTNYNKYVDVSGDPNDNFAPIVQHDGHNGNNQKFLIYTLDNGYSVIAARHSGKVVDVRYINFPSPFPPPIKDHLIQHDFKNGDNQKFRLATEGTIEIQHDGQVWDVEGSGNKAQIIPYHYHGGSNQKFRLEKSGSVSIKTPNIEILPSAPDFKTDDLNEELPDETTPVVTHVTYLPYFMVKDSYYNPLQKIQDSPYYVLVRRQFWKKITHRKLAPSEAYDYEQITGVSRTDQTSMTETTEISIGADLGFMFKGFSLGLSTSITKALSVTKSTSNTESTEKKEGVFYKNPFNYQIAYARYMLINEYYVTRANGEMITTGDAAYWRVPNPERTVSQIIPRKS